MLSPKCVDCVRLAVFCERRTTSRLPGTKHFEFCTSASFVEPGASCDLARGYGYVRQRPAMSCQSMSSWNFPVSGH
jgi:hypothetical protein